MHHSYSKIISSSSNGQQIETHTVAASPNSGAGPKSSSLLLSPSSSAGWGGNSSSGAGGGAGPITLLRFSPPSGLLEREGSFLVGCAAAASSALRFLLARRWGGNSGPIEDMLILVVTKSCMHTSGGPKGMMHEGGRERNVPLREASPPRDTPSSRFTSTIRTFN